MYKLNSKIIIAGVLAAIVLLQGCATTGSAATSAYLNHDRRNSATAVNDQTIDFKATMALVKQKELWDKSHISTLVYNNNLLLVGQTPSDKYKVQAEKSLKDIKEIHQVYNQISVNKPISLNSRAKDTWITTQLKLKIVSDKNLGPNRVKIITEDGTVYLMGILTKDESEIATSIAKKTSGVNKVVTIFEDAKVT